MQCINQKVSALCLQGTSLEDLRTFHLHCLRLTITPGFWMDAGAEGYRRGSGLQSLPYRWWNQAQNTDVLSPSPLLQLLPCDSKIMKHFRKASSPMEKWHWSQRKVTARTTQVFSSLHCQKSLQQFDSPKRAVDLREEQMDFNIKGYTLARFSPEEVTGERIKGQTHAL